MANEDEDFDPTDPAQRLAVVDVWLEKIHRELEDLNNGIGMILKGEYRQRIPADEMLEELQTIRKLLEQRND